MKRNLCLKKVEGGGYLLLNCDAQELGGSPGSQGLWPPVPMWDPRDVVYPTPGSDPKPTEPIFVVPTADDTPDVSATTKTAVSATPKPLPAIASVLSAITGAVNQPVVWPGLTDLWSALSQSAGSTSRYLASTLGDVRPANLFPTTQVVPSDANKRELRNKKSSDFNRRVGKLNRSMLKGNVALVGIDTADMLVQAYKDGLIDSVDDVARVLIDYGLSYGPELAKEADEIYHAVVEGNLDKLGEIVIAALPLSAPLRLASNLAEINGMPNTSNAIDGISLDALSGVGGQSTPTNLGLSGETTDSLSKAIPEVTEKITSEGLQYSMMATNPVQRVVRVIDDISKALGWS